MGDLTKKQEDFCLSYIETGNATESYRRAYNPETASEPTINRKAKALMDSDKIRARIDQLRAPVREKSQLTLETHLADLKRLRDLAEGEGKYSAAVTAEVSRGRASGLYVEKVSHEGLPTPQIIINRPSGN